MRKLGIVALGVCIVAGITLFWSAVDVAVASKSEKASEAGTAEDTLCIPLGMILIEAPDAVEPKKTPVEFPHADHFGYTCRTCHHTWQGDAQLLSCTTSGCHDLTEFPEKTDSAQSDAETAVKYFKTAYHQKCIGCHKEWTPTEVLARVEAGDEAPDCDVCGQPLKSKTVSFGQPMPQAEMEEAVRLSGQADLCLAIGSSLVVEPAASIPRLANRAKLVIINNTETPLDFSADLIIREPIGETMRAVLAQCEMQS